ncbi:uncharacterized protein I206_100584 [Kwoniella pini CBS 10737]|uniref:BTB domain-containing protein n=1 Tax=Kwoniella pini CBS 10737 TaxID=1296096 RepID=A0A1B9ICQ6_9TREE|nr:uncharacterized protein I206_00741 [Kwoniella pini CBS 10737]OCF53438.1 hypothetical protein I206_00741 [Kwoniella pini CBS 10737]
MSDTSSKDSTKSKDSSNEIKYHPFYNKPRHKVIIRSKDNIYLRADRDVLIEGSTFFADLLDTSGPVDQTANDEGHPIELDFTANAIGEFLNFLSTSDVYFVPTNYDRAAEMYRLSTFIMSDDATSRIRQSLKIGAALYNKEFDLLRLSSEFNDIELAKMLIQVLIKKLCQKMTGLNESGDAIDGLDQFQVSVKQLRPTFRLAFEDFALERKCVIQNGRTTSALVLKKNWNDLAGHFNPEQYE